MKNETERHGERPEFDEHANEESYFALKEHELVEDMKAEFRGVQAARREAQMATCPKCSGQFANTGLWDSSWIGVKLVKGSGSTKANSKAS
jgi:hypothetical protein